MLKLALFRNSHTWGGDFALYIHQAQGLLHGDIEGVGTMNRYTLQHSSYDTFSPELYPWGWPLLLVPVVAMVGLNYFWLKVYVLGFFVGACYLSFRLVASQINMMNGLIVAACMLLNTPLWLYTDNVLSELPFLFFVLFSVLLYRWFRKINLNAEPEKKSILVAILTGFILFFTTIIRSEGYLLIGAIIIHECLEMFEAASKRVFLSCYKIHGVMWLSLGFFTLFYLHILPQGSGTHFEHFKLFHGSGIQSNFSFYSNKLSVLFGPFVNSWFSWVILVVSYVGMVRSWRNDRVMVLFLLLLQVLILVWPHQSMRYLFVQLPFMFYFLMQGLEGIGFSIRIWNHGLSLAKAFMVFLLIGFSVDAVGILPSHFFGSQFVEGPETPDSKRMFEYIRNETDVNSSIVFFKPRVMSLYTQRKSFLVNDRPDKIRKEGDYLVIHKFMRDYDQLGSIDFLLRDWLKVCYENKTFVIYKVFK